MEFHYYLENPTEKPVPLWLVQRTAQIVRDDIRKIMAKSRFLSGGFLHIIKIKVMHYRKLEGSVSLAVRENCHLLHFQVLIFWGSNLELILFCDVSQNN